MSLSLSLSLLKLATTLAQFGIIIRLVVVVAIINACMCVCVWNHKLERGCTLWAINVILFKMSSIGSGERGREGGCDENRIKIRRSRQERERQTLIG